MEDREDVVTLDGRDDVLGAADDLREALLHLLAGERRVILHPRACERRENRGPGYVRCGGAELLDDGQGGAARLPSPTATLSALLRYSSVSSSRIKARGVGFEQFGELRRSRPELSAILLGDALVGGGTAESPGELPEQRVQLGAVVGPVNGARRDRASIDHCDTRPRKSSQAGVLEQLANHRCRRHALGIAKQVIGGEQCVGLAAAELGLQSVDAGRCRVAVQPAGELDENRTQAVRRDMSSRRTQAAST